MELEPGSLVLDVGCGNGKYIGVNQKNLFIIGTDRSKGLLDTALEKDQNYQLFAADSLSLPVRSGVFDCFISIAVIHHFSNDQLR
jgi:ubiquinone/menaquinone biosynthesis C-methylase UbiE